LSVSTGSRLGPYEILAPLGAGGMGEVWRARDTRLERDVAIKVLPPELDADPERLRRFEREARAVSSLSHPNIVTVFEVAREGGTSFIVMELVEGQTLRGLVSGSPMPLRKILAIAPQVADGLARAHASGIVHRDLKPENVMVTEDGRVKILDFGLAKLTRPEQDSSGTVSRPTVSMATRPGIVMGTVSYMSPEQALGHPLDFRSDQFAFGSVLYEMATGKPAFHRESAPQTLTAIIEDDPDPVGKTAPKTPPPLRWVIDRCLAKEPKGRYASTEDLARELSDMREHLSELSSGSAVEIEPARRRPRWRPALLGLVAVGALAVAFWLGLRVQRARTSEPRFRQLTYLSAGIGTARFTPDGQTIVFSTQKEGRPPELLSMRLDDPETRSLGLPPAEILSISSSSQMALLLSSRSSLALRVGHIAGEQASHRDRMLLAGTLARAPLGGGAPRELLEDVSFADWDAEGKDLAVAHRAGNRFRLEYPIGTVVWDDEFELLNHPKISSRGSLAFKDWDSLYLRDRGRPVRPIKTSGPYVEMNWFEPTGEIWSTVSLGSDLEGETALIATSPSGSSRVVARLPGDFVLFDVARDGRVLLGRLVETTEILGSFPGEMRERDLSLFATSEADALTGNGDAVLLGDINISRFGYLRKTDGSEPKRWREDCAAVAFSPDGRSLLCFSGDEGIAIAPAGPGPLRKLEGGGTRTAVVDMRRAGFLPDGKRIYFPGIAPKERGRVWVQDLQGGKPRSITPDDVRLPVPVGDGRFICARASDGEWSLYPVDGNAEPRRVLGILPGEEPIQSIPDGSLFVRGAEGIEPGQTLITTRVYRVDPLTGTRALWKEIAPRYPNTGGTVMNLLFSADGRICVWNHLRYTTELVLVEGLK
jgi:serine/threonine protein kinase